jgi:NAD(P)-dependent dehydrogenase (short-subunit alcohol dehydrogenase family)
MMDLEGRVAVVTGAASGIGEACAQRLRAAGCRVMGWDVRPGEAVIDCDVSSPQSVAAALERTEREIGSVSLLVAAAGLGWGQRILDIAIEDWDRMFAVNLRGVMLTVQAIARPLVQRGSGGAMVLISSINSVSADLGLAAYGATKAGVNMFARVAARELGPDGVRVNAIGPGPTETPMLAPALQKPGYLAEIEQRTPLGAIGRPADIAEAAVGLLQLDWVTGQAFMVDGGASLATGRKAWI